MDRWKQPIVGYVKWWLLRGLSPMEIKQKLADDERYPELSDTEWEEVLAAGTQNARFSTACRNAKLTERIDELWHNSTTSES